MNKRMVFSIIISLYCVSFPLNSWAWDDTETHPLLGEYSAEISILGKDDSVFLKQLGFSRGLKQEINVGTVKKTIKQWIKLGEELEDEWSGFDPFASKARFNNHFHTATKQMSDDGWLQAGLDDWTGFVHSTGESSIIWAQDAEKQQQANGGDRTWQQARTDYFTIDTDGIWRI